VVEEVVVVEDGTDELEVELLVLDDESVVLVYVDDGTDELEVELLVLDDESVVLVYVDDEDETELVVEVG
jgi:hypothetical protein